MVIFLIAGPSGGGKTTLAQGLKSKLKADGHTVELISMDNYYKVKDVSNPRKNFDTPDALDIDLLITHLKQLYAGQAVEIPKYSFQEQNRLAETLPILPADMVIVEGIFALTIAQKLDDISKLSIYIQPDSYLTNVNRRAARDVKERGLSIAETKQREVSSNVRDGFFKFVVTTKVAADIDISNNDEDDIAEGIEQIINHYQDKFKDRGMEATF
ncbi:uridine kinase [Legionella beliardensis]|uniref:Uridine kinase n=1 Tax=Legionella beliardensis TaxID=91822 RepID=A0A378I3V7_9GAMM|nr:uridine kinase [Legionella beliardensis]STX29440.1 uridine kinase [Legionella beliardensis]